MYDLILGILGSGVDPEVVSVTAAVITIVVICVVIDLVYRIFSHFWK